MPQNSFAAIVCSYDPARALTLPALQAKMSRISLHNAASTSPTKRSESWVLKFGPVIVQRLCRARPSNRWHLDEGSFVNRKSDPGRHSRAKLKVYVAAEIAAAPRTCPASGRRTAKNSAGKPDTILRRICCRFAAEMTTDDRLYNA
jgi:hypothetical protein